RAMVLGGAVVRRVLHHRLDLGARFPHLLLVDLRHEVGADAIDGALPALTQLVGLLVDTHDRIVRSPAQSHGYSPRRNLPARFQSRGVAPFMRPPPRSPRRTVRPGGARGRGGGWGPHLGGRKGWRRPALRRRRSCCARRPTSASP